MCILNVKHRVYVYSPDNEINLFIYTYHFIDITLILYIYIYICNVIYLHLI